MNAIPFDLTMGYGSPHPSGNHHRHLWRLTWYRAEIGLLASVIS